MPIYTYFCPMGHEEDQRRSMADRNEASVCDQCLEDETDSLMRRGGIELPFRPFVVGGTCIKYRN